jgi:phenylalanyl-tRNA synthetase beta chain
MKILTNWLRTYVPNIPADDHQLADDLTLRGIAVEGVHNLGTSAAGKSAGHLFEMDITTNRVDAMNHYGIAREAATIYNLPLAPLHTKLPVGTLVDEPFPIRIDASAKGLCGRFTAQVLRNVTIAPSTGDIKTYFEALGQKQISNAVDASNFVLLGMGHPTHAFDLDKIEGGIVLRLAKQGEKLKLLDGTDRTLEADDLVVADEKKTLALAGVMGGWDSMITPETKNILVEAAWFDPASIRRSARRHGLHTDASHRFERGADFNACPAANALVAQLILQHGGKIEGELIDVLDSEVAAKTATRPPIELSVQQVQRHLGATLAPEGLTKEIVSQFLTSLGCELILHGLSHDLAVYSTKLPSWRLDLEREIDLIEEVARVYGYNGFANTLPPPGIVIAHPTPAKEAAVRTRLLSLGFSESISSTFASHQDANLFFTPTQTLTPIQNLTPTQTLTPIQNLAPTQNLTPNQNLTPTKNPGAPYLDSEMWASSEGRPLSPTPAGTIPLENPLSEEATLLRPSLIPGMLNMLSHNLNRDVKDVRLFEQGHIFTGTPDEVQEASQLSLGLTGAQPATPLHSAADAPFFELKGAVESILSLFTPPGGPSAVTFTTETPQWLQPGRSATALLNNHPIAHFGELAHAQKEARKLRQPIYLAQLDLAKLYELPLKRVTAHDLSRFQAVERDFSFTFPDTTQWHTIASAIHALAIPELQRLTPPEIFRDPKGKSVPPAHYALLLKCIFQSHERTLREDELTTWWSTIISTLTQLGGLIRAPEDTH